MILVGNARGGGRDLAQHLMKDDNERVVVHQLRGFASDDLDGAFREAYAISRGTRCQKYLYSLSLNPPKDAQVSASDFEATIDRAEAELGLTGQPRAIVFHEKKGLDGETRRHAHAVWNRVDIETMRARQMAFDRTKLNDLSREIFLERGWVLPPGYVRHQDRDPRTYSLAEWQQAKRAEKDPMKLKEMFQDAWAISDGKTTFAHALRERGLVLARGDRRGHVAVDFRGEVYPISRWTGIKAKIVRDRLGDLDALPSAAEAHDHAKQDIALRLEEVRRQERAAAERTLADVKARKDRQTRAQAAAQAKLAADLETKQKAIVAARDAKLRTGLLGVLDRLTGKRKRLLAEAALHHRQSAERAHKAREAAALRHASQRDKLQEAAQKTKKDFAAVSREIKDDITRLNTPSGLDEAAKRTAFKAKRQTSTRSQRRTRNRDGPTPGR